MIRDDPTAVNITSNSSLLRKAPGLSGIQRFREVEQSEGVPAKATKLAPLAWSGTPETRSYLVLHPVLSTVMPCATDSSLFEDFPNPHRFRCLLLFLVSVCSQFPFHWIEKSFLSLSLADMETFSLCTTIRIIFAANWSLLEILRHPFFLSSIHSSSIWVIHTFQCLLPHKI